MKPATASVRPEGISIRFRPENTWLNSPFGPEQSPLSALSRRSFMKNADFMKPATASADNGTFLVPNTTFRPEGVSIRFRPANRFRPEFYLVEFALRARKTATLGALATQFHEKCGLDRGEFSIHEISLINSPLHGIVSASALHAQLSNASHGALV